MLLGGRLDADTVGRMALRDKVVVYVADFSTLQSDRAVQVGRAIRLGAPKAVLVVANVDPAQFAQRLPRTTMPRTTVDLRLVSPPVIEVSESAVAPVLRAARVDLAATRGDTTPVFQPLPALRVRAELRDSVLESLTAPNTVGILEGTDPVLRKEYLVFSAHMDHIGITPGGADSVNNGADDDASGTAGVIELAEAFSRPGGRPKRSIIFLTVSGEEKGLWGSRYFSEHPAVPIEHDRRRSQHRHDRAELARHDRRHRQGAFEPGRHARPGEPRPSRAPHDRHRRPLAGGALLFPLGSLQLRPQGRADPVLLQRGASGLSPA